MPRCRCGTTVPIGSRTCGRCKKENKILRRKRYRVKSEGPERAKITKEKYAEIMRVVYDRGFNASDVDELLGRKRGKYFASVSWRVHQTGATTILKADMDEIERWIEDEV